MIRNRRSRVTHACDFCHRRGLKCKSQGDDGPISRLDRDVGRPLPCLTCTEYGQNCTRNRQPEKRGTKPRNVELQTATTGHSVLDNSAASSHNSVFGSRRIVTALLDVYLDSIHPTFPLYCEKELWVGWRDGTFPSNRFEHMSLTCMCALSAQHIVKRALFTDDIGASMGDHLQGDYLAEALRLVPTDFETDDLDLVRSYGFLALLGMQTGANAMLHKYLGLYHGLCAQLDFHDEARWPADISECERESRRRVWWAMYRLEVHTSCVLGNPVRVSEVQCYVRYPCGTHHPNFIPGRNGEFEDWFTGWNTTTDLYRVLEHAISDLRVKRRPANSILGVSAPDKFELIMQRLSKIQEDLLPQFGTISFRSDDSGKNRCGFQASHILCTVHLARLMSCISGRDNITLACYTAREMITSIENIPQEYFRAIGSPLIQQLVGVGHILISVADARDLSEDDSSDIREIVQSLVTLLRQWYPQNTEGAANLERLTTRLTQTDILQQTREFVVRERGFSELEGRNTHCDLDDFTSQLLMNFDWPYLEL